MTRDLLQYSRAISRPSELIRIAMDSVVRNAVRDLNQFIEKRGAKVTCDALPTIVADPRQMIQLVENLIFNGIRFNKSEEPTVHISASREANDWLFSVKDNGIGIGKEHFERIFEMFQRLHTKDLHEGAGIGLPTVKKTAERHGGRVWVESEERRGSTSFFTISARESKK